MYILKIFKFIIHNISCKCQWDFYGHSFSDKSKKVLETVHPYLQLICYEAIKIIDFTPLEGLRNEEKQNNYFHAGKSKLKYPQSRHNKSILLKLDKFSDAIDLVPYPIDWDNKERFQHLSGIIKGIALSKGIQIEWGGDWNKKDLPHFQFK